MIKCFGDVVGYKEAQEFVIDLIRQIVMNSILIWILWRVIYSKRSKNIMNINLNKHSIGLILDALESYQLDIEHGNRNGIVYVWTENEVGDLVNYLSDTLEKNND